MTNDIVLEQLRVGIAQRISPAFAEHARITMGPDGHSFLADEMTLRVEGFLLAEKLPPTTLDDAQRFTVPRFATWWDHWKATHRERWWMWMLRDWGMFKTIRYVDEPHTHRTTVQVASRWTYPKATVAPASQFGMVVLKTESSVFGETTPW